MVGRDLRSALKTRGHGALVEGANAAARFPRTARALFAMLALHDTWRRRSDDEARFLALCAALSHLSHAQALQDLWALFETDLQQGGWFVEFGAHDGVTHSNTILLEERFGWSGLLCEPNPAMASVLRSRRSAAVDTRCVWSSTGGVVDLTVTEDAELSTVASHAAVDLHSQTRSETVVAVVPVVTVSLDDLLAQHGAPARYDLLSVDTEGTELEILRSADFDRFRPRLLAVEHNHRDDEALLDDLMRDRGYERRFRAMSDWDAWYRDLDGPWTRVDARGR